MVRRAPAPPTAASPTARAVSLALALALIAAALIAAAPARAQEVLRLTGTGSALGAIGRLARAFELANPGVKVHILPSLGTSGSIKAVAAGAIDLGLAGRLLDESERGLGVTELPLARSPFVFATGPRAGVTGIGLADLVRIYGGEQRVWPGGERIRPVLRPARDTDSFFLRALAPALGAAYDAALARPGMLIAPTNQDSDALAARTRGSLAVTTLAQLVTEPSGLTPLAWEGVAPTLENLAAGRYPLWKPFYAIVPARVPARTRQFLQFAGAPEGRKILEASGCLPPPFPVAGAHR
jgi:phosphate transport system substrate-binding protein